MLADVAFLTVADAAVFAGLVALLNSLRLVGHLEPLYVVDAGLTGAQRAVLRPHVSLLEGGRAAPHPTLLKPPARLPRPPGVVFLLDSDAVVTGSLAGIAEQARRGAICAFPDPHPDVFFDEWSDIFALRRPLRRATYVSAHFVAFSTGAWPELMPRWREACERVVGAPVLRGKRRTGPVHAGDQDALNALLMSEVPREAVHLLPVEERAHDAEGRSTKLLDRAGLTVSRAGRRVLYVHYGGAPKPWQREARRRIRLDVYTLLLPRLLHGRDVTLRYPPGEPLAPWARAGARGALALRGLAALNALRSPGTWAALGRRLLPARAYRLASRLRSRLLARTGAGGPRPPRGAR